MYLNHSIKDYLSKLSSDQPTPGGGGTSALVAALGVALALMVARIGLKHLDRRRKKSLNRAIKLLEHLKRDTVQVIDLDPKVYQEVIASYRWLKRSGKPEKAKAEVENALVNSFRLQADLALMIVMAKQLLGTIESVVKGSIRNDLIVSGGLLDGAFRGAVATARINTVYIKRGKRRRHCEQALHKVEQRFRKIKGLG